MIEELVSLEAKNIVADDGKEAVRITSYFNEEGDGIVWKKVTEWTDRQDEGISSGLAEKDFNTNFQVSGVVKVREII